jgi:iron complex transport system substrate-binding protein
MLAGWPVPGSLSVCENKTTYRCGGSSGLEVSLLNAEKANLEPASRLNLAGIQALAQVPNSGVHSTDCPIFSQERLLRREFSGIMPAMKATPSMLVPVLLLLVWLATTPALAYEPPLQPERPQRIVSLGLCTDQLLLMMVERERISSLTFTAVDEQMSFMADQVGDIPLNYTNIEEIIPYNPDLVVGSTYASHDTVRMLRMLGYNVKLISLPTSIAEIRSHLIEFASWVGSEARARELIQEMDQKISSAQHRNAHKPERTAIIYSPNGYTIGANTLENDVLLHAGYRNLSAELGIKGFRKISLETLITTQPDYLQIDNHVYNPNSLANAYIHHPALERMVPAKRRLFIPSKYRACAGPTAAESIAYMADQR